MKKLINLIFNNDIKKPANVLLVLGTSHGVDKFCAQVSKLHKKYNYKKIIISGYKGEAGSIAFRLFKLGIAQDILLLETQASNTLENFTYSLPLINQYADKKIHIIGKLYAMPRVKLTALNYLADYQIDYESVDLHEVTPLNWLANNKFRVKVSEEFKKIKRYSLKGDIFNFEHFYSQADYNDFVDCIDNQNMHQTSLFT